MPRDPNRIPTVLAQLGAIWRQHPDMRLAQLIGNVYSVPAGQDPYFVEDEDFVASIGSYYRNMERL